MASVIAVDQRISEATGVDYFSGDRWLLASIAGLFLALLMVLAVPVSASEAIPMGAGKYGFVDSDELSEVEVAGQRFSIPRRYFWGFFGVSGGKARSLNLKVLLPDFSPYSPKIEREFIGCPGWCRVMTFTIQTSVSPGHRGRFINELVEWNKQVPLNIEAAKRSYSGLRYLSLIDKKNTSEWGLSVERGYFFDCRPSTTPQPSCTIIAVLDDHIELQLTFSKDYLPQHQKTLEQARRFVREHAIAQSNNGMK